MISGQTSLSVALLINPVAGLGGAVGLLGSDGEARQKQARALGAQPRAAARCARFLERLRNLVPDIHTQIQWHTWVGSMGQDSLSADWRVQVHGHAKTGPTDVLDTRMALREFLRQPIDLLIFVGGDGTARDVLEEVGEQLPVLGLPAGVKMHSGVFAVSPDAAARVLARLVTGGMVASIPRQVRDYGPSQRRDSAGAGAFVVETYGELRVPDVASFLQHTKVGGVESEPLAVEEIVADLLEQHAAADAATTWVVGPGSTCFAFKQALGLAGSLRGFDVWGPDGVVHSNATAAQLVALSGQNPPIRLVLSFTREQGFLIGRGNQQLAVNFLRKLDWPDQFVVVGTRTKLLSLQGRPLLVDSSDEHLDQSLCGLIEIVTGYEDRLLYRVARDLGEGDS